MSGNQQRKTKLTAAENSSDSDTRSGTRLLLPPSVNPQATEAALKQVIEDWVLPRLLEEFLREKGITPKSPVSIKPGI